MWWLQSPSPISKSEHFEYKLEMDASNVVTRRGLSTITAAYYRGMSTTSAAFACSSYSQCNSLNSYYQVVTTSQGRILLRPADHGRLYQGISSWNFSDTSTVNFKFRRSTILMTTVSRSSSHWRSIRTPAHPAEHKSARDEAAQVVWLS